MKIADLRVGQIVAFGHRESDHGPADETWTVVDLDLRRGVVTLARVRREHLSVPTSCAPEMTLVRCSRT